ncbi:tryptophan synthase beta subunit-like PLP-dependent enzyme [Coleophoma cylindrospora]|uniref:L-serine ammonia-lyase n=1 Tax=Coleophoma cylindrospora TaxID=1849047 RepID=A0A3D8QSN7_9HELO|nr:tryptophan synthase beta subunit-like PLP-dependent enzyme [Coleophoma cylindrospora]
MAAPPPKPWVETPCVKSTTLSNKAGCNIYLKLENQQPSGSFKSRGLGNHMLKAFAHHGTSKPVHFYCSSGGNAGMACATAAISLGRPATIVVPLTTSAFMIEKLKSLGVEVVQMGRQWSEADSYLREELLAKDEHGVYVPPFDHPDVWEGHSTLVDEVERTMLDHGGYDAMVCSVGGGGLFSGIMESLEKHGRLLQNGSRQGRAIKVLAIETVGTGSLAASLKEKKLVRLPAVSGIANTLGAAQVAERAFEYALRPEVVSATLSDAEAAMGSVDFADDERILVESACGATLATAYNGMIRTQLFPEDSDEQFKERSVVLVVCGGSAVNIELLHTYRETYGKDEGMLSRWAK